MGDGRKSRMEAIVYYERRVSMRVYHTANGVKPSGGIRVGLR